MKKLYQIMEQTDTKLGRFVDSSLLVLVVCNVIVLIIDSYNTISLHHRNILSVFEYVSIVIFTIEYLMRLLVSPYKYSNIYRPIKIVNYIITPMALIDLLAILPFYLPLLLIFDFRILRLLRLFRLLRVLKIKRYSKALDLIVVVFRKRKAELLLSSFILIALIFFAGSLMYYFENPVQPNEFPNIIDSVLWSIKTMVFLGYDDIAPVSTIGKIFGMLIVVLGLGWLTLPISILSSGFVEEINHKKELCPHCGKEI